MSNGKYQLLPPLGDDEFAALREDIQANGIRVPIDVDENSEVLDGHHRKAIALMLGIECPERIVRDLEDFEKVDYALTVNLARRHLDRAARRELVKKSLMRDPIMADREHARRCGVHHDTVGRIRADLQALGKLQPTQRRKGGDGKERQLAESASSKAPQSTGEIPQSDNQTSGPGGGGSADGTGEGPDTGAADNVQSGPAAGDGASSGDADHPLPAAPQDPPAPEGQPEHDHRDAPGGAGAEEADALPAASTPADPGDELVQTPIGPMPRKVAAVLDKHAPDPNPHHEWQKAFLDAVFAARKAFRKYSGEEIAEKADAQLLEEFGHFVADLDDLQRAVSNAQIAEGESKVRHLRRVQ
ncbi:ParB N-terminal domain-containing protein [Dactylosporangium roseum]|uniref:ParB N-terminal domain-containing protein n=1 Tax=Dactylosporangium roseum TaxID=47989 RepID=A0ABY5Z6S5_9ACTN|nr:ParB N-terminal domain-containing protein [Dactylosporangium roseum]UWZ37562.1 ParB N-terminal domain-containing protein [Dactylosporangium roseum]